MGRPMKTDPTPIQREVLDFIGGRISRDGRPPTQNEIADHFGWAAHSSVRCHLTALSRKGLIQIDDGAARGIRLVGRVEAPRRFRLPLLAEIPAGLPVEADLWSDEYIEMDGALFPRPDELFALRVKGESMTGAGIFDGDRLIVRRAVEANSGEIVVARIDSETTVKRLILEGGRVILRPENPKFRDIVVSEYSDFAVQGIAVGSLRVF